MAGLLRQIRRLQKSSVEDSGSSPRRESKLLQLQTAKEILAEVFRVRISEVEVMIQNRYEEDLYEKTEPWPREFWVGEGS